MTAEKTMQPSKNNDKTDNGIDVTFLIPVYNSAKTLERLLVSLLAPAHDNIEIVLVNDGSTDNSLEIAKRYDTPDVNMKIVDLPENRGTLSARIAGIKVATGKYILAIDPDDAFDYDGVPRLLKLAKKKGEPDIVTFDLREYVTDADGNITRTWSWCPARHGYLKNQKNSDKKIVLRDLLKNHGHYWNLCLKMVKKEFYVDAVNEDLEDFYCIMCEDLYMNIAIEGRAKNIYKANYAPYRYYNPGITSDKRMTLAGLRRQYSALKALELSEKMLPDDLIEPFREIELKSCRNLLARAAKIEPVADAETAKNELLNYGFCTEVMKRAAEMPILESTTEEDFLNGSPKLKKIMNTLLPKGTRRRVFFKAIMKRLLGR